MQGWPSALAPNSERTQPHTEPRIERKLHRGTACVDSCAEDSQDLQQLGLSADNGLTSLLGLTWSGLSPPLPACLRQ